MQEKRENMLQIPKDILENRKLILNLSKNDFKSKFAGSYFGVIWAYSTYYYHYCILVCI